MNLNVWIWLPPISALICYAARIVELGARRDLIRGKIRENMTLRLFILVGSLMTFGGIAEYLLLRKSVCWPTLAAGWVLVIGAFALRRRAIAALGRFWSLHVEIRDSHQLVREGPFRWVRHPAYLSMIIELLSLALILRAWWTGLVVFAIFLPTLLVRIRIEETALIEKFGESYLEFKRTTPSLFPRVIPLH